MVTESIKPGYKQTEVGIIPEDWDIITYDSAFNFLPTATYSRAELTDNQDILYIHYGDIHTKLDCFLDFLKINLPSIDFDKVKNYQFVKDGDLIMVDASEDYEGISKSVEVKNIGINVAISGLHTFLLRDKNNNFVDGFKGYIHLNSLVKSQFYRFATGMKVYGVSKNNLKFIQIPYPLKKEEQSAIAQVLSDTDLLIESLDKLIEKKKNIKQGIMQELLTGKRRLQGFKREWSTPKLGEICNIYQPEIISQTHFIEDGFLVYGANGIIGAYSKYNHENWQTIVTCRGSTCGTVNKTIDKCWITGNAMVLNIDNNKYLDKLFFYYLIDFQNFNLLITGSGQPQIIRAPLYNYVINLPTDKGEQAAIAEILLDMDSEIEQLEKEREKYKKIKIGMMQELLTGRIRLK